MSTDSCLVKAIYSFKGKNNDELCFKKGDIITVTQKEEGGWWEGTLGETTGWFPSNYVTEFKDASGSLTTSPIRAASEIQAFRNVVLKDIIDSEKAHVAEMQGLVSNFLQPLEKSEMLTKDEFRQLTGNINEVLQVHEQFLALLEECAMKTGPDQRVGGLFLQWAPKIKTVHQTYCSGHPKAVCILDKYKEDLNTWMENAGAVCPGVLVLTAGLSKPFRRLGKYPAMLQELARHVHEAHPDRGDTHRASVVYKDIASACAALRRQKELELQVVTGEVRGWPGGELTSLGDVLHMGSVAVGPSHQDRYLVLFPSALLLLSVSKRVSAFVYEGCLPLTGITVCKLDDTETRKNAFEISGPMIDRIVAVCQTRAEADNWVSLLQKHSNNSSPSHEPSQPQSLPHLTRSPSEGALSSINCSRRSLYHVTMPPSSYPSASPYYSLTKYFARLVKKKVITRQMLRKLLHEKTWAKAFELTGYPVRRRHKNHIKLKIDDDGTIATETECSDSDRNSEDSDREMESTDYSNSSCTDAEGSSSNLIIRQNALDSIGPRTISSSCSSWGSNFGYVRYFDTSNDMQCDMPQTNVVGDCTKNIFVSLPSDADLRASNEYNLQRSSKANNLNVITSLNQHSDSAENSSFEVRNYNGCEDLVNMDQNIQMNTLGNEETDFIPTRQSFPNYNARNGAYPKLWKSNEEYYNREDDDNNNVIMYDLLQVLDPPSPKHCRDFPVDSIIIDPPPMFRNEDEDLKILNVNLNANIPFRKHSINSDKRIRRSMSRSMVEAENKKNNNPHLERMSSQSETSKVRRKCECCNRSLCPSPRSSDSGVAGSCNLASPDLNMHGNDSDSHEKASDTTDSLNNLSQNTFDHRKLTLSEIEAANFEDQCRCTSPFGSTARTSCVTSVTSETSFDVKDVSNTNVTSTFAANPPLSSPQIKRTSIRRNIESYVPVIKLKPEVPPRIYRKPSTHMEFPKNVRQPVPCQWSTLNITERSKPSLHYHMRIYREKPDENTDRPSRKNISRNCNIYNKVNKQSGDKSSAPQKTRSRSEDLSKMQKGLTEVQSGFMVYRSDLYAHWWMKAKLPITVVTDSGKDYFFMAMSDSSNELASGLTNHKRSHSFNNHQSYTQHMQQTQKSKQKNQSARWLLNSCDSLDQSSPAKTNKVPIGKKFSSVDFIDTADSNYSSKGWSITCLRPAPPLRPQSFTVGSDENIGPTHPYAPHQRKSNSYEEDALILKVIEAYCTSARCRNAVSSVDCGHFSLGKVQYHAPATNIPHFNYSKLPVVQRSETPELSARSKTTKVKRNKSSSAADTYLFRVPEARKLLSERKFQLNRSNPNLWDCSERRRANWMGGYERRSGSQPSLAPLRATVSPAPAPRSARSSTWCCGSFVKQLTKSHHFD
ncbi:uncharacterized protein RtGEF isoform X2 [Maniola hyperantus]|uniref:uncharacterized protein RtGEF isoform X2 n=1 Tax=Aphantopus hyperantus TaxID=2795564 RepID=UPI00213429C7